MVVTTDLPREPLSRPFPRRRFRNTYPRPGDHDEHEQGDPRGVPSRPRPVPLGTGSVLRRGRRAAPSSWGRAWDNFDFQLTRHHEGETDIAWPALVPSVGVTQQMIDQMDAEHDVMAERLAAARASMTALRACTDRRQRRRPRGPRWTSYRTVTTEHLDHEERELEPVYQAKKDDPAIKEMGKKFSKVAAQGRRRLLRVADRRRRARRRRRASTPPSPRRSARSSAACSGGRTRKEIAPVWRSVTSYRAPSAAYPGLMMPSMIASRSSKGRNADFIALMVNHRRPAMS